MALVSLLKLRFNGTAVTGPRPDGAIPVVHFHHKIKTERHPASGKIVGKRHGLFSIRKALDKTTPIFHRLLQQPDRNAGKTTFELIVRQMAPYDAKTNPHGGEQSYMLIELEEPQVVSIETTMPDYNDPDTRLVHEYEDIDLVYKAISFRGLVPGSGGTVEVQGGGGTLWIDWAWQSARVQAAKLIAETMGGEKDDKDDKKKDDKKDDDKKP